MYELKKRSLKLNRRFLWFGIIFFIVSCLFFGWCYSINNKDFDNPIPMTNLVVDEETEDGTYVSLSVTSIPELFAEYDNSKKSSKYYFLWENHYLSIGYLDYDTYQYLNDSEIGLENPKIIYGQTKHLSSDVIKIAIDYYNDTVGEQFLTLDNYSDYIGDIFIDTSTPFYDCSIQLLVAVVFGIVSILFFILYFLFSYRLNYLLSCFSEEEIKIVDEDFDSKNMKFYKKVNVYLTKNYLIDLNHGINIFKYQDIIWIYPDYRKYTGDSNSKNLIVWTKNKKKHKIADATIFIKTDIIYKEIINNIKHNYDHVMIGYTKDNRIKAKKIFQLK